MINKIVKSSLVGLVGLMLVGCDDYGLSEAEIAKTSTKMNTVERALFQGFNSKLNTKALRPMFNNINLREQRPPEDAIPFCDVIDELIQGESVKTGKWWKYTIQATWIKQEGVTLSHSCVNAGQLVNKSESQLEGIIPLLTKVEKDILTTYATKHWNDGDSYEETIRTLKFLRGTQEKSYTNLEVPFCDVVSSIYKFDEKIKEIDSPDGSYVSGLSITGQWKSYTGQELVKSCANNVQPVEEVEVETPSEEEVRGQILEDTVVLKGKTLLSAEKVREITEAAKDCKRAKNKMLDVTEGGGYLTVNDYEQVNLLILDCVNLQMQIELNK